MKFTFACNNNPKAHVPYNLDRKMNFILSS